MKKTVSTLVMSSLFFSLFVASCSVGLAGEDSWVTKASMWQAREGMGVVVVGEQIFVIGGYGRNTVNGNRFSGTIEVYSSGVNKWSYPNPAFGGSMVGCRTPMPTPRNRFGIAVVDDKIYCIGGWTKNNETAVNEVYNPKTDTWETKASMPTARATITANVVDGKIYVIAGRTTHGGGYDRTGVTEVYDPEPDSWTTETPIPTAVSDYASAVVDNKIYVLGGQMGEKLTQIYDPQTKNWSFGSEIPHRVCYGAAGATTGVMAPKRIYLFGGANDGFNQIYNPEKNSWTLGPKMPTSRILLAVTVLDDKIYALGGDHFPTIGPTCSCTVVEQYTPVDYIPEFSSLIVLPLFVVATVVVIIVKNRLFQKRRIY